MKRQNLVLIIFLAVFIILLSLIQRTQTSKFQKLSVGQLIYKGSGYSFRYPANAYIDTLSTDSSALDEIRIRGPQIAVKPGYDTWVYEGPSYELTIKIYENKNNQDAEEFGRNYILTTWQNARQRGDVTGYLPVTENGQVDENLTGKIFVAENLAFWANYFAGDATIRNFFLANERVVILFSFNDYPLANQPLALIQQDIYGMIMGTFLFEPEQ